MRVAGASQPDWPHWPEPNGPVGGDLSLFDPVMRAVLNEEQYLCGGIRVEFAQPAPAGLGPTHVHTASVQLFERSLVELLLQFRK